MGCLELGVARVWPEGWERTRRFQPEEPQGRKYDFHQLSRAGGPKGQTLESRSAPAAFETQGPPDSRGDAGIYLKTNEISS
jgi:hypothetical protein